MLDRVEEGEVLGKILFSSRRMDWMQIINRETKLGGVRERSFVVLALFSNSKMIFWNQTFPHFK